ncbi:MAG: phage baseplate assembly protein V [Caldilineaceae bacterium]
MSLEKVVADLREKVEHRYYGKYRGFVVDNVDPEHLGRLTVRVPSVLGEDVVTGWALPCVSYGGAADQGFLFIPEKKAGVWVEFEEGDLEFPIWTGTFWSAPSGDSELPKPNDAEGEESDAVQDPPTRKMIKTLKKHTIQFEDADKAEMIMIVDGVNKHVITLDQSGIKITDGIQQHMITLDKNGITISEGSGKSKLILANDKVTLQHDDSSPLIVIDSSSVKVGSERAIEPFVLGNQLKGNVNSFLVSLATHTHVASSMGGPTTPPSGPFNLEIPVSSKHTVE